MKRSLMQSRMLRIAAVAAVFAAVFSIAAPMKSTAHSGAKGIVKERMEVMKAIAKAMKLVGMNWLCPMAPAHDPRMLAWSICPSSKI